MCVVLLTVDPALGRLEYDSLSEQALMEMLIDGIAEEKKKPFQDTNGSYLDVSEWRMVTIKDSQVTAITESHCHFSKKQFPFRFIPPHVEKFRLDLCHLHGTLDPSLLPQELKMFNVCSNALNGTINFKALPQSLKGMYISNNAFSGGLELADLPHSLRELTARKNQFSGEISLDDLPPALEWLSLPNNLLAGSINIERLTGSLRLLNLSDNLFSGDFRMSTFPEFLRRISVERNPLSGKVVLREATGKMPFDIFIDNVSSVVDENGNKHNWHDRIMQMSKD